MGFMEIIQIMLNRESPFLRKIFEIWVNSHCIYVAYVCIVIFMIPSKY